MDINTKSMHLTMQYQVQQADKSDKEHKKTQSSGSKLNEAKNNPAGLVLSLQLQANMHLQNQNIRQSQDNLSSAQIADASLQSATHIMFEMRDLAVQASNDVYGDTEKHMLDEQFHALQDELMQQVHHDTFGQQKTHIKQLLNSDVTHQFENAMADLASQDIRDTEHSGSAIEVLDVAIQQSSQMQAEIGAQQNIQVHRKHIAERQNIALSESNSRIADADYGEELIASMQDKVKKEINTLLLAQSTPSPKKVAHLIS